MPGCMVLAVSEEEPIAYAIPCGWLAEMGLGTPGRRAEFACSRWKALPLSRCRPYRRGAMSEFDSVLAHIDAELDGSLRDYSRFYACARSRPIPTTRQTAATARNGTCRICAASVQC
jgi:hypothetical protein